MSGAGSDEGSSDERTTDAVGPPSEGPPPEERGVDELPVDELRVDELRVDELRVDELRVDELRVDELPGGLRAAVEAVLMVVDEPVAAEALAAAVQAPLEHVQDVLEALGREYAADERGFELRRAGAGWRVYSRADLAGVVGRFVRDGQTARLSQAALETLAIIAYRQPVSRARVSAVRGVDVDGVVRTLLARGLVVEVGRHPASGAMLYGTTPSFLERMGLASLDDLPPLAPFLPEGADLDDLMTEGQL